jgi:predicted CoA-binding protein
MSTPPSPLELLDDPGTSIALVGATDDPRKFGSTIYRDLKRKGFKVYPINPNRATVDGDPAYPTLADLPEPPDLVNLVVPPAAALAVLRECLRLGLTRVWLQPGAEDEETLAFLDAHRFDYLARACIMVKSHAKV